MQILKDKDHVYSSENNNLDMNCIFDIVTC